jgi:hypothetical protein
MPNWGQVLKEIAATTQPLDAVRRRYLASLAEKRGRNVIAYYSGWLQKTTIYRMRFSQYIIVICILLQTLWPLKSRRISWATLWSTLHGRDINPPHFSK